MGFLNFLFGKKEEPTVENEFFGTMTRDKIVGRLGHSFICKRHFAPVNDMIDIRFEDDKSGKTHRQEAFVRKIESRYLQMCEAFAPHIEREIQKEIENFKITDFQKEFKIYYLELLSFKTTPLEWVIEFDYYGTSSKVMWCILELSDDTIKNVYVAYDD